MFIQLTAFRTNSFNEEYPSGKVTIRKDHISAVVNTWTYNHERKKDEYIRGDTFVYLLSGKVFAVKEKVEEVEAMLMSE